jgi:hypothetical protein
LTLIGNHQKAIILAFNLMQPLRSVVHHLLDVLARPLVLLLFAHGFVVQSVLAEEFPDIGPSILLLIFLVACFLGLLLGVFAALVLAGIITGGIISASVMTAVLRRSVSSGFRALFLQIGGVLGLVAGGVAAMMFMWLANIPFDSAKPWIIGLLTGAVWGVLAACLFNFAWGRIVAWATAKLQGKAELPQSISQR